MTVLLYILGVLAFLAAIFLSIALHEFGHLYWAKKFGCRVSEFMIGFGPRLFSKRIGETVYGVKLIPFGGYVKIIGMFPPQAGQSITDAAFEAKLLRAQKTVAFLTAKKELTAVDRAALETASAAASQAQPQMLTLRKSNTGLFASMVSDTRSAEFELIEPADQARMFYKLPPWKKITVMAAGPAMNIAIAFLCFLGIYSIYGVNTAGPTGSTLITTVSDCVIPERENRTACQSGDPVSPARAAGIEAGDTITAFNNHPVGSWDELSALIRGNGTQEVAFTVLRDGLQVTLPPVPTTVMVRDVSADRLSGEYAAVGYVGIGPERVVVNEKHGPVYTARQMAEMTGNSIEAIVTLPQKVWNVAQAVTGQVERDPEGPVSIVGGSRVAGEVASSEIAGITTGDKAAMLVTLIGSLNLFLGIFNLVPLLPLDGGHIVGAAWESIRRKLALVFKRRDPGPVDVAVQLPFAYVLGLALTGMGLVLIIGDLIVPLSTGL